MKITQRLLVTFLVILTCFVGLGAISFSKALALANREDPVLQLAKRYQDIPSNPSQETENGIYDFAWEAFIALNWPDPRCNGKAADFRDQPNSPRVWECYPSPGEEIDGDRTNNPRSTPIELRLGEDANGKRLVETLELDEDTDEIRGLAEIAEGSRPPLVDQSGNYVLNEIRISPAESKQIIDNGWTSHQAFEKYTSNKDFALICSSGDPNGTNGFVGQFPCLENVSIPSRKRRRGLPGAIEIKAAWMILESSATTGMTPSSCQPLEFTGYKTTRTFHSKQGNDITVPVGLVGFHIVQKTSTNGWVWSTFEHNNNVPDSNASIADILSQKYNFFGSKCAQFLGKQCQHNTPYVKPPYEWSDGCPHAVTKSGQPQIPSQITRVIPILDSAETANHKWYKTIQKICAGDPTCSDTWTQYKLIGSEWLETPDDPYSRNVYVLPPRNDNISGDRTAKLANVSLEPYIQAHPKLDGQSCIKCHQHAALPNQWRTKADFSFLFRDMIDENKPLNALNDAN